MAKKKKSRVPIEEEEEEQVETPTQSSPNPNSLYEVWFICVIAVLETFVVFIFVARLAILSRDSFALNIEGFFGFFCEGKGRGFGVCLLTV